MAGGLQHGFNRAAVQAAACGFASQLLGRGGLVQCIAIRPWFHCGAIAFGGSQHPVAKREVLAPQTVGITRPVQSFVMVHRDLPDGLQPADPGQDPAGQIRMQIHPLAFGVG
ncbi:Uncharacterised protein [Mycobacterium tuberculosis]|nr:Uncharacterised protein [Mycobacterium tuberculosis]